MKKRKKVEREALLDELDASGQNESVFCRRKGTSPDSLRRWRRERYGDSAGYGSFLPAIMKPRELSTGLPSRMVVSGLFAIECYEMTSTTALEMAIRAAVTACGPISAR